MSVSKRFRSSKRTFRERASGYRSARPMISDSSPISEKNSSHRAMSSSSEYSASVPFLPFALPGGGPPGRAGSSPIIRYLSRPTTISLRMDSHGGEPVSTGTPPRSPAPREAAHDARETRVPVDEPGPAIRAAARARDRFRDIRGYAGVEDRPFDHRRRDDLGRDKAPREGWSKVPTQGGPVVKRGLSTRPPCLHHV